MSGEQRVTFTYVPDSPDRQPATLKPRRPTQAELDLLPPVEIQCPCCQHEFAVKVIYLKPGEKA